MMEIIYSPHFLRSAKHLTAEMRLLLEERIERFSENHKDPAFHAKPLAGKWKGYWSFRVGRNHRVLYRPLSASTVLLYDVDDRKDIYL